MEYITLPDYSHLLRYVQTFNSAFLLILYVDRNQSEILIVQYKKNL